MYYEINVAKNGKHYFATAPRSLTVQTEAMALFVHFCIVFPKSEGYSLSVRLIKEEGTYPQWQYDYDN